MTNDPSPTRTAVPEPGRCSPPTALVNRNGVVRGRRPGGGQPAAAASGAARLTAGTRQTIASRFDRWREAAIWGRIPAAVRQPADAAGRLGWGGHYMDGTVVRAHQRAVGVRGGATAAEPLGRGRGGFSAKVQPRAEGGGKPPTLVLTPGQRHEASAFELPVERGAVKRTGCGRRPGL